MGTAVGRIVGAMSTLTESEVFDRLRTSLRSAADLCGKLATVPAQGPNFIKVREELKLIEGAARQVGNFREDMRWMRFGFEMWRFHQRIGDCIRSRGSREIFLAMKTKLADALRECELLRTVKTGRRGMILPKMQAGPHRETRPVQVSLPSGLIVPSSAVLH